MRILGYLCVFLACGLLACFFWANMLQKENTRLRAEKNGLKIELNRREEVKQNVQEREKIVEKLVYKDKEVFDWHANIGDTAVVNELRKQCKSCTNTGH